MFINSKKNRVREICSQTLKNRDRERNMFIHSRSDPFRYSVVPRVGRGVSTESCPHAS